MLAARNSRACSRWRSQLQHRRLVSFSTHVPRKIAFSPERQNGAPVQAIVCGPRRCAHQQACEPREDILARSRRHARAQRASEAAGMTRHAPDAALSALPRGESQLRKLALKGGDGDCGVAAAESLLLRTRVGWSSRCFRLLLLPVGRHPSLARAWAGVWRLCPTGPQNGTCTAGVQLPHGRNCLQRLRQRLRTGVDVVRRLRSKFQRRRHGTHITPLLSSCANGLGAVKRARSVIPRPLAPVWYARPTPGPPGGWRGA